MTEATRAGTAPPISKTPAVVIHAGDRIYDNNLAASGIALIVDGDRIVYWSDGGPDHVMGLMWCYTKEAARIPDRAPPPAALEILRECSTHRRMLIRLLGVRMPDTTNTYANANTTAANMATAIGRIAMAKRLARQIEDLISGPSDDPTSPGWAWADDVPAALVVGLADHVGRLLNDLEDSAINSLAMRTNDSRMKAVAARRSR